MHTCPECGTKCYCDGQKRRDEREAHYCVHCCAPERDRERLERAPGEKGDA